MALAAVSGSAGDASLTDAQSPAALGLAIAVKQRKRAELEEGRRVNDQKIAAMHHFFL